MGVHTYLCDACAFQVHLPERRGVRAADIRDSYSEGNTADPSRKIEHAERIKLT